MRRCQEVLGCLGVHGAPLTATVPSVAEVPPVGHTHVNPNALIPDTSVSTDLAIHPSLRSACDTALHNVPKAYVQALQSRISTLEQCVANPTLSHEEVGR